MIAHLGTANALCQGYQPVVYDEKAKCFRPERGALEYESDVPVDLSTKVGVFGVRLC